MTSKLSQCNTSVVNYVPGGRRQQDKQTSPCATHQNYSSNLTIVVNIVLTGAPKIIKVSHSVQFISAKTCIRNWASILLKSGYNQVRSSVGHRRQYKKVSQDCASASEKSGHNISAGNATLQFYAQAWLNFQLTRVVQTPCDKNETTIY